MGMRRSCTAGLAAKRFAMPNTGTRPFTRYAFRRAQLTPGARWRPNNLGWLWV